MTFRRGFDAACYLATGLAVIITVASGSGGMSTGMVVSGWIGGILIAGYGLKVLATRSQYWINTAIYFLPFLAVIMLVGVLAQTR